MSFHLVPKIVGDIAHWINPYPRFSYYSVTPDHCGIAEGWLDGPGNCKILRLSLWIENDGDAPYIASNPLTSPEKFVPSNCMGRMNGLKDFLKVEISTLGGQVMKSWLRAVPMLRDDRKLSQSVVGEPQFYTPAYGITNGWLSYTVSAYPQMYFDCSGPGLPNGEYKIVVSLDPGNLHATDSKTDTSTVYIRVQDTDLSVIEAPPVEGAETIIEAAQQFASAMPAFKAGIALIEGLRKTA